MKHRKTLAAAVGQDVKQASHLDDRRSSLESDGLDGSPRKKHF